jgi:hypothetical protein
MKKLFIIGLVGALSGCSSSSEPPSMELNLHNREVEMMGRQEVISAIEECRSANLRPVMIYSRIKVNNHVTPIIIDITCAPSSMIKVREK